MFDYFDEVIKFDPVNHYICFSLEEIKELKKNIKEKDLKIIKEKLEFSLNISYEDEKRSVIYKKYPLKEVNIKDYISLATYYWPDETKPDGLPYINHDGKSNPEGALYDKDNLRRLAYITYYSALLYYLTDEKKYHDILVKNCTYYFLDEKTGMNPNLNHAQMIRGINMGRGIGIIDYSANFSYALIMIKHLKRLDLLDLKFYNDLSRWLQQFLVWLKYSVIALEEKHTINNHGTIYDFLLLVLYDFLDMASEVVPLVYDFIEYRLSKQINESGQMPHETGRTKSISYSLMGFKGLTDFAKIAKWYNFDLWNINNWYYKKIEANLKSGLDYLYKYLVKKEEVWPFKQITVFDTATLLPLIFEGVSQNPKEYNYFSKIDKSEIIHDILALIVQSIDKNYQIY